MLRTPSACLDLTQACLREAAGQELTRFLFSQSHGLIPSAAAQHRFCDLRRHCHRLRRYEEPVGFTWTITKVSALSKFRLTVCATSSIDRRLQRVVPNLKS